MRFWHELTKKKKVKDETRGARGSSALHAASDTVLELKKNKDVVCVRAVKQRDPPHYFTLTICFI